MNDGQERGPDIGCVRMVLLSCFRRAVWIGQVVTYCASRRPSREGRPQTANGRMISAGQSSSWVCGSVAVRGRGKGGVTWRELR
jgi:hypothetical protein